MDSMEDEAGSSPMPETYNSNMEDEAGSSPMPETYNSNMEDEMENVITTKNVYNEFEIADSDEDDGELVFSRGGKQKKKYSIVYDMVSSDDEEKMRVDEATNAETLEESDMEIKDTTRISEEWGDMEDFICEEQVQAIPKKKIVKSRKKLKKGPKKIASRGMNEVIVKDKNPREPLNKNFQIMNHLDNRENASEEVLEKEDKNSSMCSEEQIEDSSEKKFGRRRRGGKGSKKKIAVKRTEEVIVRDTCDEEPNDKENGDGGVLHKEDANEGMKDETQVEEIYGRKINKSKIGAEKGLKKSIVLWDVNEVIVKDMNNPESSNRTTTKKAKIMGMIFMCTSNTKKDCYRYKILGLPSNKRDEVLKISKGMKLFLFDVDLKLLYGIYKAAGPGGYNIEPKAFKSAFPSQVRFDVFQDCLPLPVEKFKKVIKDNYFKKNKFHSELTLKQVKNLCKLFQPAPKPERVWRDPEAHMQQGPPREPRKPRRDVRSTIYKDKDKRRKRNSGAESHALVNWDRNHAIVNRDRSRKRRSPEAHAFVHQDRSRKRRSPEAHAFVHQDRSRKRRSPETHAFVHQDRSLKRHRDAYGRGEYSPPVPIPPSHALSPVPLPPSRALLRPPPSAHELSPGSFAYEGRLEMNGYRRDSLVDHHDRRFRDLELRQGLHHDRARDSFQEHHDRLILDSRLRHREEIEYRDPYVVYRERPSYHDRLYYDARPSDYVDPVRTSRYDDVSRSRGGLYDSYVGTRSWY